MTEYFNSIFINDGPNVDAFSRLRVSNPFTFFSGMATYGHNIYFWDKKTDGTNGTVTEIANQSSIRLSTGGTASGNYAIRQTHSYIPYIPGKSQLTIAAFCMGVPQTNSHTRIGYFDENNGIFLERGGSTGNVVKVVQRTYTSGSISDANFATQANWNIDPMNGSGPSGVTLDFTKTQILLIDFQWLGVGRVRVGFVVNGIPYYVHQFLNTNSTMNTVYMQTPMLPMRFEVWNDATSTGTLTCDTYCATVISEGLQEPMFACQFSASNGYTPVTLTNAGTMYCLLGLRPATSFTTPLNSLSVTNRAIIEPTSFTIANTGTGTIYYEFRLNPTVTGTALSWGSVNSNSMAQAAIGTNATTISGGTLLQSGYCTAGLTVGGQDPVYQTLGLVYADLTGVQDTMTISATGTAGGCTAVAALNWEEVY